MAFIQWHCLECGNTEYACEIIGPRRPCCGRPMVNEYAYRAHIRNQRKEVLKIQRALEKERVKSRKSREIGANAALVTG